MLKGIAASAGISIARVYKLEAPKVEIDYTTKKNLKKPPKAKPGFVIYHTNYSMSIEPDIHGIAEA